MQVKNIIYYETWAPVAKLTSIWTILAITAHNSWANDMFNFHSTFLNSELSNDKEVYMEYPPGLDEINTKCFCLRLKKLIYRLKQGGCKWYNVICQTFASLGFKKSRADPDVFYPHSDGSILVMAIHVDDCTITGNNNNLIQQYKKRIQSKYSLTDLGLINWLLEIKKQRLFHCHRVHILTLFLLDSTLLTASLWIHPCDSQRTNVLKLQRRLLKCARYLILKLLALSTIWLLQHSPIYHSQSCF